MNSNTIIKSIGKRYNLFRSTYLVSLYTILFILAFIIVPVGDASLYFHETVHIAESIKGGCWVGNEPIGTHGFIFKLLPALLFLIFGVNPLLLSFYHLFLSFSSIIIFEKILENFFKDKIFILSGIIIIGTSYFFISGSITYYREIPVLFSSLLLFYAISKDYKSWKVGLLLLLVLDAKEHVFFQIVPGIILYRIYKDLVVDRSLLIFIKNNFFLWISSILYVLLMLFTGIIPVNSFIISILPLSDVGTNWVKTGIY